MFEDVAGDGGLVNARVFVRFQMLQRILGDALVCRRHWCLSAGKTGVQKEGILTGTRHLGMCYGERERHGGKGEGEGEGEGEELVEGVTS
jgi:hypothetical protein